MKASHRILLTGANGFLGSEVKKQIEADPACRGLFLSSQGEPRFDIQQIAHDPELSTLSDLILDFSPTALLHLAWAKARKAERNDAFHLNENFLASRNLFDFVHKHLPECRLISVGSQAELGIQTKTHEPNSEGSPLNNYGKGKALSRDYLLQHFPRQSVWLRVLTLYGPGDHEEKFIPYLLNSFKKGIPCEISPGEQLWDFLHVQDAAAGLVAAAKTTNLTGVHLLVSGESWPLKQVAEVLAKTAQEKGYAPKLKVGARPYAQQELMLLTGDPSSLQKATGWKAQIPLQEGLRKLFN